jgi:iron(III) transport system substrate-binding protein
MEAMPAHFRIRWPLFLSVALLATHTLAADPAPKPSTAAPVLAAAEKEGKLVVYSTTDSAVVAPLLKDFATLHPGIAVEYNDMNSTELYNRFVSEAAAGVGSGDLLWSSAMDLQMKLANDGYAAEYESPEVPALPPWAVWKNEAFGTTFEPIAFVYNKRLLKPEEVPQSHAEMTKALTAHRERFNGKLTSYDPERSGLGFLLLTQDSRTDSSFAEAMKAYGSVGVKLYTSTGAMMERIQSGEHLIGFNMIGSYAILRQRKDPSLGVVYPKDYTLVMSRIALIPKAAKHPNASKVFLDYILSARGQEIIANKCALFSIRGDVQGEHTSATLHKTLGATLKPIAVGPSLLVYLDQAKRLEFLKLWQQAIGTR